MPRKRKSKPSGVITVLVIVGGAVLLIAIGNWLKGVPQRRVPPVAGAAAPARPGEEVEIQGEERQRLEHILERGKQP